METPYPIALFSYGTLQLASVQMSSFGRLLKGKDDILVGYRMGTLEISNAEVVKTSGQSTHLVVIKSGDAKDEIAGKVFQISQAELLAADEYEDADYKRIEVILKSGQRAWLYVKAD